MRKSLISFKKPGQEDPCHESNEGVEGMGGEPCYVIVESAPLLERRNTGRRRFPWTRVAVSLVVLALALAGVGGAMVYMEWPKGPEIEVVDMKVDSIHWKWNLLPPLLLIDLTMNVTAKITNPDAFGASYDHLLVHVDYRGTRIGTVVGSGGYIPPKGKSLVDVQVDLRSVHISDALHFLEDVSHGQIPFHTNTRFDGFVIVLGFKLPMQATVNCDAMLNTKEQIIARECTIG